MTTFERLALVAVVFSLGWGSAVRAEDRDWTDEKTKRVIKGEIVDKKPDSSAALIRLAASEKTHWIQAARLIEADREYIRAWKVPVKHLSATYKRDEAGKVTAIVIRVVGFDEETAFVAKPVGQAGASLSFTFHVIEPNETREVELEPGMAYTVEISGPEGNELASLEVKATPDPTPEEKTKPRKD
ncbi:MAG: hypothetical protein J0M04_18810 [Verrucomicrobia bacterium]|nr:hypothetical protein [Verrucomicrobiota bacterium]